MQIRGPAPKGIHAIGCGCPFSHLGIRFFIREPLRLEVLCVGSPELPVPLERVHVGGHITALLHLHSIADHGVRCAATHDGSVGSQTPWNLRCGQGVQPQSLLDHCVHVVQLLDLGVGNHLQTSSVILDNNPERKERNEPGPHRYCRFLPAFSGEHSCHERCRRRSRQGRWRSCHSLENCLK